MISRCIAATTRAGTRRACPQPGHGAAGRVALRAWASPNDGRNTTAARAGSVHEARSVLADRHRRGEPAVDLALVDLYLPDGSGLELVRTLACDVLVLSAATEPESVRAVLRLKIATT